MPPPRPGSARPEMELRPEPLPAPADWKKAASRAEALFGLHVNPYLTAAGVAELAADIQQTVDALADDASGLVPQVEHAYQRLGLDAGQPGRLATARAGSGPPRRPAAGRRRPGAPDRDARQRAAARHRGRPGELAHPGARRRGRAARVPLGPAHAAPRRGSDAGRPGPVRRQRAERAAGGGPRGRVRQPHQPCPERRRGSPLRVAHRQAGSQSPPGRQDPIRCRYQVRTSRLPHPARRAPGHGPPARRTRPYSSR